MPMKTNVNLNRRSFLKTSLAIGATYSLSPVSWSRVIGANDTIQAAVVGVNGRGGAHISELKSLPGVRVAALCDVDRRVLAAKTKGLDQVRTYQDVRELLENKDIDVVTIATTNHWHSLITIWACQAGKDVYVEKPCSHNVFEGRQCVAAARQYQRIVQHGTQSRSGNSGQYAALVQSGKYGKLLVAKGYCCKPRWSIGYKPISQPPKDLDFDLWLGPAPRQPYHANLVHYNWHWFWDFGNGDVGNQGVHEMDVARWGLGGTLPRSVISLGCRYVDEPDFRDQGETPNQLVTVMDFGGALLLFETRGLVDKVADYPRIVANEFYFEGGVIKKDKFYPKGQEKGEPLAKVDYQVHPGGHFGNFINCVRSRKREELNAEILEGHLSSALCHLGNASYRLASRRPFEKPKDFSDNQVVGDSIMTLLANTKAIGMDPEKAALWVGPKLEFDAQTEKFTSHPEANQFITRVYRPPFVVPDKV